MAIFAPSGRADMWGQVIIFLLCLFLVFCFVFVLFFVLFVLDIVV